MNCMFEPFECKTCTKPHEAAEGLWFVENRWGRDENPCLHCTYNEPRCTNCVHGPYPCNESII